MADPTTTTAQATPAAAETTVLTTTPAESTTPAPEGDKKPDAAADTTTTLPADGTTPEHKDAAATPAAEVPATYVLNRPEDGSFTDEDMARYTDRAKLLGLTQVQAQAFVDREYAEVAELKTALLDDLRADKDLGGSRFDTTVASARQGIEAFLKDSPQDERDAVMRMLDTSGYGNHKALVRAFARLGKMTREDSPDSGGRGGGRAEQSIEDLLYDHPTSPRSGT